MSARTRREACMRIICRMQNQERGELIAEVINATGLTSDLKYGMIRNLGTTEWAQMSAWVEYMVSMEDNPADNQDAKSNTEAACVPREEDDGTHDCHSVAYNGETCVYCGNRSCCAAHPNICYECWAGGKHMPS